MPSFIWVEEHNWVLKARVHSFFDILLVLNLLQKKKKKNWISLLTFIRWHLKWANLFVKSIPITLHQWLYRQDREYRFRSVKGFEASLAVTIKNNPVIPQYLLLKFCRPHARSIIFQLGRLWLTHTVPAPDWVRVTDPRRLQSKVLVRRWGQ